MQDQEQAGKEARLHIHQSIKLCCFWRLCSAQATEGVVPCDSSGSKQFIRRNGVGSSGVGERSGSGEGRRNLGDLELENQLAMAMQASAAAGAEPQTLHCIIIH